jgi:hypothetical protein
MQLEMGIVKCCDEIGIDEQLQTCSDVDRGQGRRTAPSGDGERNGNQLRCNHRPAKPPPIRAVGHGHLDVQHHTHYFPDLGRSIEGLPEPAPGEAELSEE